MTLWARVLRAYAAPDVERLCLLLQDEDGQCVSYLLWALWAEEEQRPIDEATAERAAALARTFETGVLGPLRTARRSLKGGIAGVAGARWAASRERIKNEELAAEELLLAFARSDDPDSGRELAGLARRRRRRLDSAPTDGAIGRAGERIFEDRVIC